MRRRAAALALALGVAGCGAPPPSAPPPSALRAAPTEEARPPEPQPAPRPTYVWDTGTRWLGARQNADGSWGRRRDPGRTGLVVLAYLSCGDTHRSGESRETVRRALESLVGAQGADGAFADLDAPLGFSTHALGTLALAEAYGMTRVRWLRDSAQRAVDVLLADRREDGGWEGPSSIWAVMALKAARMSELDVPEDAATRAAAWYGSRFDVTTGRTRMRLGAPSASPARLSGDALVAGAILARVFAGESPRESDELRAGARRLLDLKLDAPVDPGDAYLMTVAMWQMPNSLWVPWVERLRTLVPHDAPLPADDADDDAIRDVALRVLTWRGTQGYRRVLPDSPR